MEPYPPRSPLCPHSRLPPHLVWRREQWHLSREKDQVVPVAMNNLVLMQKSTSVHHPTTITSESYVRRPMERQPQIVGGGSVGVGFMCVYLLLGSDMISVGTAPRFLPMYACLGASMRFFLSPRSMGAPHARRLLPLRHRRARTHGAVRMPGACNLL
jgi:hypothetical protein